MHVCVVGARTVEPLRSCDGGTTHCAAAPQRAARCVAPDLPCGVRPTQRAGVGWAAPLRLAGPLHRTGHRTGRTVVPFERRGPRWLGRHGMCGEGYGRGALWFRVGGCAVGMARRRRGEP